MWANVEDLGIQTVVRVQGRKRTRYVGTHDALTLEHPLPGLFLATSNWDARYGRKSQRQVKPSGLRDLIRERPYLKEILKLGDGINSVIPYVPTRQRCRSKRIHGTTSKISAQARRDAKQSQKHTKTKKHTKKKKKKKTTARSSCDNMCAKRGDRVSRRRKGEARKKACAKKKHKPHWNSFLARQNSMESRKNEHVEGLRAKSKRDEMRACTFHPRLNPAEGAHGNKLFQDSSNILDRRSDLDAFLARQETYNRQREQKLTAKRNAKAQKERAELKQILAACKCSVRRGPRRDLYSLGVLWQWRRDATLKLLGALNEEEKVRSRAWFGRWMHAGQPSAASDEFRDIVGAMDELGDILAGTDRANVPAVHQTANDAPCTALESQLELRAKHKRLSRTKRLIRELQDDLARRLGLTRKWRENNASALLPPPMVFGGHPLRSPLHSPRKLREQDRVWDAEPRKAMLLQRLVAIHNVRKTAIFSRNAAGNATLSSPTGRNDEAGRQQVRGLLSPRRLTLSEAWAVPRLNLSKCSKNNERSKDRKDRKDSKDSKDSSCKDESGPPMQIASSETHPSLFRLAQMDIAPTMIPAVSEQKLHMSPHLPGHTPMVLDRSRRILDALPFGVTAHSPRESPTEQQRHISGDPNSGGAEWLDSDDEDATSPYGHSIGATSPMVLSSDEDADNYE